MATDKAARLRLGIVAIALCSVALGTGFMACASDETLFGQSTGAGGTGGTGGSGGGGNTCDVAQCPDPPFSGLEKCCTANGVCGVRSGAANMCYPPGMSGSGGSGGTGGVGGMGGMGGGKL
jgi:hypothetical protein